jgi:hypothetical protein
MIKSLLSGLVLAVAATSANAAFVVSTDLFNTGVDSSGNSLADGTIGDPHYALVVVPGGTSDIRVRTSAGGFPIGPWLGDEAQSAWIGPNNDGAVDGPGGSYAYRTTFTIPANVYLPAVTIAGKWAADDNSSTNDAISLNGNFVSIGNNGFGVYTNFSIGSTFLVHGVNTLDFIVTNGGGPTGLRVSGISATAVPEPASLGLFGVAGLALVRRRKA